MITILRRMMYRIATRVAKRNKHLVLINGESVGQVASQTLSSMSVINNVCDIPVLRPVCCMDKLEIIDVSKKINTYDISILPYEDCCTVYVPKHPVINPNLDKCIKEESKIDYQDMLNAAIGNIFKVSITDKDEFEDLL